MSTPDQHGSSLLRLNLWVTLGFAAIVALTHVTADTLDVPFAVLCAVLFVIGIGLSGLGFWNGIQRSRLEEVSLAGLLAVDASFVAKSARNAIWITNVAQIVVAIVAGTLRPFTGQAFALLVPMFGVGIATVWGSRHAVFHRRDDR